MRIETETACACSNANCLLFGCQRQREHQQLRGGVWMGEFNRPQPTQGWVCPKCGSVWAPDTHGCFTCNKPAQP